MDPSYAPPNMDPQYGYGQQPPMSPSDPYAPQNPGYAPQTQQPYMMPPVQTAQVPQSGPSYADTPVPAAVHSSNPSYAEPISGGGERKKKRRKKNRAGDVGMGAAYAGSRAVSSDKAEYCCYCCVCWTVCVGYLALICCEVFSN